MSGYTEFVIGTKDELNIFLNDLDNYKHSMENLCALPPPKPQVKVYGVIDGVYVAIDAQVLHSEVKGDNFRIYAHFHGRTRLFEAQGQDDAAFCEAGDDLWVITEDALEMLRPQARQLETHRAAAISCNASFHKTRKTRKTKIARVNGFNYTKRRKTKL